MRIARLALLTSVVFAACTQTPVTPSSAPQQRRLDAAPDTTNGGSTAVTPGSGLFGSGH